MGASTSDGDDVIFLTFPTTPDVVRKIEVKANKRDTSFIQVLREIVEKATNAAYEREKHKKRPP